MSNRYFNKQTTNARQALAQGGSAGEKKDPRTTGGPRKGRPGPMGPGPKRKGTPSIPEFPIGPGPERPRRPSLEDLPKGGPKRPLPRFKKKDTTDRKKIITDRIKRNKIKDRLDKLKQKMGRPSLGDKIKPDPKGTGKGVRPNPTPRKPSPEMMEIFKKRKQDRDIKRMKNSKPESPERIKRQADYMKKHGKNEPRRKTLSVKNSYKKEVEGLK